MNKMILINYEEYLELTNKSDKAKIEKALEIIEQPITIEKYNNSNEIDLLIDTLTKVKHILEGFEVKDE